MSSTTKVYEAANLLDGEVDQPAIQQAVTQILGAVGEDPQREGLQGTPDRVARAYSELLSGYRTDPVKLINGALFEVEYDDMVIVRDIEFFSLCEHHMLPFIGRAHVAYIPRGKVIGLSKIPRMVDMFSRRLQVQERLTRQIADFLCGAINPLGAGVVVEALHMCSMMRGVKKHDARMTTSTMVGSFRSNPSTRQEFLDNLARGAERLNF
ncbi:MAG: GTP cyclohydrolase I FolE [Anaerolineales bacterium]|jgi:GTP cyclohydrolase I|nr:GTP cyclohydrolase I FolE [Anaerolineales bacterium]MBX3004773.1 GTP cyclohydrolase I FolE [Anaerolineales bacterium]MCW5838391.1 GTP cyclohydrolase I FolE [Anaerolineales bacterium]MCW5887669.1 GTP cyclohydrolase I FolE [Anaerolineales bacterium]